MPVSAVSSHSCVVCDSQDWEKLPGFDCRRTVTTSGLIVDKAFGKAQCATCGLVQRIVGDYCGDSDFYEQHYEKYYNRPGTAHDDNERYKLIAELMFRVITPFVPTSIVDVGCGVGSLLKEMSRYFPEAYVHGIEPSLCISEKAKEAGFEVVNGKVETVADAIGTFDLVYAINVLQHSVLPVAFLESLRSLLNEKGLIVVVCPDATNPGSDVMWIDQNYSFCPNHLFKLAEKVGLSVVNWCKLPEMKGLCDRQLAVFAKKPELHKNGFIARDKHELNISMNIKERCAYLNRWFTLDEVLMRRVSSYRRLFHFGASMWTYLIRAYCPRYWQAVDYCVVDNDAGVFMDKVLLKYDECTFVSEDVLLLGVHPLTQPALEERFSHCELNVVTWYDLLQR